MHLSPDDVSALYEDGNSADALLRWTGTGCLYGALLDHVFAADNRRDRGSSLAENQSEPEYTKKGFVERLARRKRRRRYAS